MTYIHQNPDWPNLRWDNARLLPLLADVRHRQGRLLGRMEGHISLRVRVNRMFHCMSPVGASMYCSPQPAALHIAPAARLRGFCL
jgi:hypothetical protein